VPVIMRGSLPKPVPFPPQVKDVARASGIIPEFLPEPANAGSQRTKPLFPWLANSPDSLEEFLPGDCTSTSFKETSQEIELMTSEVYLALVNPNAPGIENDAQI
jgi:hypothetical protein